MERLKHTAQRAADQGKKLLIPYLVAGDPNLATTLGLMHQLVEQGADIIELGIPFSDPSSDGPVIQRGVERSLTKGTTLAETLGLVREFRQDNNETPIVLMGYLNPVEIMGYEKFVHESQTAGVDGVLIVDMPPAESNELHSMLHSSGIDTIFLVAPTTRDSRIEEITTHTSGYLYYVSLKGVTGAALTDYDSVRSSIEKLRGLTELPIVIGFGIKDADSAAAMASCGDGVIIGSALVEAIAKLSDTDEQELGALADACDIIGVARQALDTI